MRSFGAVLLCSLLALLVFPSVGSAQSGNPPPDCCPKMVVDRPDFDAGRVGSTELFVTEGMVETLGFTRAQFVDRLSDALFPGKQIDLVMLSTRFVYVTKKSVSEGSTVPEDGLVAVQERRFHQVARRQVRSEILDSLDQLYITDGEVYVKVSFVKGEVASVNR